MNAILALPESHAQVLRSLLVLIPPQEIPWVLTGSAGLRLQGVDIPVNDLDVKTDAENIFVLEELLREFIKVSVHPWESEHTFSLHGQAEIHGLTVELLGGVKHRLPGADWESPANILASRIWITWSGREIPALPLALEAQAYQMMGRAERARMILGVARK